MGFSVEVSCVAFVECHSFVETDSLYSVPGGFLAILSLLLALPSSFPDLKTNRPTTLQQSSFQKVDFLGCFLLLAACISLLTALQEAGLQHPWQSPLIIALLAVSGVVGLAFVIWEWYASVGAGTLEPVFTWRFAQNRVFIGMLMYKNPFLLLVADIDAVLTSG